MRPFRHALHVLVLSVLVAAFISAGAGLLVPSLGLDDRRPEHVDTADLLDFAPTPTTTVAELLPPVALTRPPAVTVAPGSLTEANDQGDPTFVPPTTSTAAPTSTTSTPPVVSSTSRWAPTGERRATDSTVYCVSGVTYSGGQTHAEGEGVGRTVAVNRDNGEWERYVGTSWRVVDGPHAGAVYTVEDAGTRAHFDMWHGDRADCRDYALGTYGVLPITVERVELRPA